MSKEVRRVLLLLHLADCSWYRYCIAEFGAAYAMDLTVRMDREKLSLGPVTAKTPLPRGWG